MKNLIKVLQIVITLLICTQSMMISKKYLKHKDKIRKLNDHLFTNKKHINRNSPVERNLAQITQAKRPTTVDSLTSMDDYMV